MTSAETPETNSYPGPDVEWASQPDWRERFPALLLLRAPRVALDPRLLVVGALGLWLTVVGWWALGNVFDGGDDPAMTQLQQRLGSGDWSLRASAPETASVQARIPGGVEVAGTSYMPGGRWLPLEFLGSWSMLSRPLRSIFDPQLNVVGFTYALLCGLWTVAVWSYCGGIITHIAAVRLAREERVALGAAHRHTLKKYGAYFWAPLFPLVGVALLSLPIVAVGWLMRFDAGILALSLAWPLCLVAGLVMMVFLVGLAFGWPLMWSTISVEGTDSFDALSRTYAYVYQRPLHYLGYVVVVCILGLLASAVVTLFTSGVVLLSLWGASWSTGGARMAQVVSELPSVTAPLAWFGPTPMVDATAEAPTFSGVGRAGVAVLGFWVACVQYLALGFGVSYFWSASTAIYLLLRKEVDAAELDDVKLEGEQAHYGLPQLRRDSVGVAAVAEDEANGADEADPVAQDHVARENAAASAEKNGE
ncbi:MAG: hypothetical protein K1X71_10220 [Pirellulales bacterium]|nr:hypothetical protein [Pirellulales bacterium]